MILLVDLLQYPFSSAHANEIITFTCDVIVNQTISNCAGQRRRYVGDDGRTETSLRRERVFICGVPFNLRSRSH